MTASTPASRNIIRNIIDNFRFDCITLKSCSLVSHSFSEYTRPHLFHLMRGISIKLESCCSVDALISISPHVRAIRLSNDDLCNATMPCIISSFVHLEHISILGLVDWSFLPEDMISALTSRHLSVASLELYTVNITDVRLLNQFLRPFVGLRRLCLSNIRCQARAHSAVRMDFSDAKPRPKELALYGGSLLRNFVNLDSPISLDRLNKLTICGLFVEDFMSLAQVINLAPNLRALHLGGMQKDSRWGSPKPLDLSGIKIVSFNLSETDHSLGQYLHPSYVLVWWIQSFRSGVTLRSVTMTIQVHDTDNPLFNERLWRFFDIALCMLTTIKEVRATIRGEKGHVLGTMIENQCKGLNGKGLMKISVNAPQRKRKTT
ncbi:hypothetical protein F5146DRAFT_661490 [Armillaria mellea]|nr:hypothetical protein F5146DRAFT_661490 [Armillaria mellea]